MNEYSGRSPQTAPGMLLAMADDSTAKNGSRVVVVGLGKIGLPLAAQYAAKGMSVVGWYINPEVVAAVKAGRPDIREEAGVAEALARALIAGRLGAPTDTRAAVAVQGR